MAKKGRPPKISDVQTMQKKIDAYFSNCPDFIIISVFNKIGEFVEYKKYTPTMTGLALHTVIFR